MPVTQQQKDLATANQNNVAHEPNSPIRLIAGPGTGKSFTIQERVSWLLQNGVPPETIFVISFTRASSLDLKDRVYDHCRRQGHPNPEEVSVSTLHSLALRALRSARLLTYPASPTILDDWEVKNIFDQEFSVTARRNNGGQGYTPGRCGEIRRDYEAFCGTGQWVPPGVVQPAPPISQAERNDYRNFHTSRAQIYSCVLPGEIVRQCVEQMRAGLFDPVAILGINHLIVDEYQDLNPIDLEFIDLMINQGVNTMVAGDDDQSIYSFRFASPQGIQLFHQRFPNASSHEIVDCFRCTPTILAAAQTLIAVFAEPNRLPKQTASLYQNAVPPELGIVHRWTFRSSTREARNLAASCNSLIQRGLPPNEIMVLLSNTTTQLEIITQELDALNLPYVSPRSEVFTETRLGRFILGLFRVICNSDDYLAHRLILGEYPNMGARTCNQISEIISANNLNFKDLFYNPLPNGVFGGRALSALNNARNICSVIMNWLPMDTLQARSNELDAIILGSFGANELQTWHNQIANLPVDMTLEEMRDFLWVDNFEQTLTLLNNVYTRLGIALPNNAMTQPSIRIMTFHGAKGLSAKVVFIPGLEEDVLPGQRRIPYNGLVLEAARMLYVSITRAKAACILSHGEYRFVNGQNSHQTPSRFLRYCGGQFLPQDAPLSDAEADQLIAACNNL
jgi:DNA helicase II / ATP-dependent DNA helicase PcrA